MPNPESGTQIIDKDTRAILEGIYPDGFATVYKGQIVVARRWEPLETALLHIGINPDTLPLEVLVSPERNNHLESDEERARRFAQWKKDAELANTLAMEVPLGRRVHIGISGGIVHQERFLGGLYQRLMDDRLPINPDVQLLVSRNGKITVIS